MLVAKPYTIALCTGALLLTAGCSDGTGPTDTAAVSVADNRFTPQENTVAAGETVTWSWTGANPHNVTFDDPSIGDSDTQTDGTFSKAFAAEGEYSYFCTVHGRSVMSGRVVVSGAPSASRETRQQSLREIRIVQPRR